MKYAAFLSLLSFSLTGCMLEDAANVEYTEIFSDRASLSTDGMHTKIDVDLNDDFESLEKVDELYLSPVELYIVNENGEPIAISDVFIGTLSLSVTTAEEDVKLGSIDPAHVHGNRVVFEHEIIVNSLSESCRRAISNGHFGLQFAGRRQNQHALDSLDFKIKADITRLHH